MDNFHFNTSNTRAINRCGDTVIVLKGENSITPGKKSGETSCGFYTAGSNTSEYSDSLEFQGDGKLTVRIEKTQEAGGYAIRNGAGELTVGKDVTLDLSHGTITPNSGGAVGSYAIMCGRLTNYGTITATGADMKMDSDSVYFKHLSSTGGVHCSAVYNYGTLTATGGYAKPGNQAKQISSYGLIVSGEIVNEGTITATGDDAWYNSVGAEGGSLINRGTMTLKSGDSPNYTMGLSLIEYYVDHRVQWVKENDIVNESGKLTIKSGEGYGSYGIGMEDPYDQTLNIYVFGGEVNVTGPNVAIQELEGEMRAVAKGSGEYNAKTLSAVTLKENDICIGDTTTKAKTVKFTPTTDKTIKKITVRGVKAPEAGGDPVSSAYTYVCTLQDHLYTVKQGVIWYTESGRIMSSSSFQNGSAYKARVQIQAREGFTFDPNVTATINGKAATVSTVKTDSSGNTYVNVDLFFNKALAAPENVKLTYDYARPRISWDAVKNADKYQVWRKDGADGTYEKIYTLSATSYTDVDAVADTTYYYKVVAIDSTEFYKPSADSAEIVANWALSAPSNAKITTVASSGKPKLTWDAVDGADKYCVYRRAGKTGEYSYLGSTTKTSYTNTGAAAGTTYYYKVKAVDADNSYANSAYSAVKSITCDLAQPANPKISLTSAGKPKLTWDAVSGADKYEVYRRVGSSGEYSYLGSTTKTSYTNTSATAGKTYYYKVKAIDADNSYANSAFSAAKSITCK